MSTITTRAGKGSPLTNNEVDANFTNLNTDKAELSGASFTGSIDVTGTATMDGLTVDGDALVKPASGSAKLYLQTSNTTSDSQLIFGDSSNNNVGGVKYSHSNDAMRFETSGAERLRIDSSGRVGIGTSSPSSSLDIVGDVKSSGNLNVGGNTLVNQASADNKYLKVNSSSSGDGGILLQRANANKWQIASNTSHHLVLDSLGGGNVLIPTGNVGIGTSSVNSNLEIRGLSSNGQVRLGGSTSGVYGKLYSDNDGVFIVSADAGNAAANSYFGVEVDGSERLRITSDGNVGIGTNSPVTFGANTHGLTINGTGNYQHLTLQNNGNSDFSIYTNGANGTIINQESADPLYFNTSGTERMRIDSSGNVGIGTSSPNSYASQTTLTINGQSYGRLDIESAGTLRASLFATAGSTTLSAATDVLSFDTSGGEAMRIDASGRVGIGQSNPTSPNDATDFLHIGSATNQDTSIVLQDAVETWEIYQNDDLSFLFDTTNVMTLQRLTGNVGIGTSSPTHLLQISGGASDGRMSFTNNARGNGQTDGMWVGVDNSQSYLLSRGAYPLNFYTNATERMRIDSSGRVGISTTDPKSSLEVKGTFGAPATSGSAAGFISRFSQTSGVGSLDFGFGDPYSWIQSRASNNYGINFDLALQPNGGNVGIGNTVASSMNAGANQLVVGSGSAGQGITLYSSTSTAGSIHFADGTSGSEAYRGQLVYNHNGDYMAMYTAASEAMRIDSSGNVGIGNSSPSSFNYLSTSPHLVVGGGSSDAGVTYYSSTNGYGRLAFADGTDSTEQYRGLIQYYHSDNSMQFYTGSDERMRIDASGNVGIGTSSPNAVTNYTGLTLNNATYGGFIDIENNGTHTFRLLSNTTASYIGTIESDPLVFSTADTERMRIDSSGNLLVGKSGTAFGTAGVVLRGDAAKGLIQATRANNECIEVNRTGSDGAIAIFAKDGTAVGSIGSRLGAGLTIDSGGNTDGLLKNNGAESYGWNANYFYPRVDNSKDLGLSVLRWDDVYATNGTIQTSDRNEKQDIEELSDAEQRVAVAAKGLLRKFRWKDSVAEKGDEARTHFGIIAQDLQAAFAAEGLDAGDYAMFISSTWTDEETNQEKTRMGVRYSELLAFIIAAI